MSARLKKLIQTEILLPALVLIAALNILFFPVLWGDKTLIHSAADASSIMPYGAYEHHKELKQSRRSNDDGAPAWFAEPNYALLHNDYFKRPVAPLWNPFNGFGAPLLANMQSQPFNPLILIACLNPSPRSTDLFVLARLLVAGVLTNLYLRRFLTAYGAIFGALAFTLTGYFMIFLNMPEISASIWMPGLFYTLELLAQRVVFGRIFLVAWSTAMILLGGMPEVSFLVLVLGSIYFLVRSWYHQKTAKLCYRAFLHYVIACVCGIALAAPQVFPFIEYVRESSNTHIGSIGAGGAAGPGAVFHSNFAAHFINYLTPLIYGPLGDAKVRTGVGYDGFNGYWGVVVFLFAVVALVATIQDGLNKKHDEQDENARQKGRAFLLNNRITIVCFFTGTALFCLGKKFGFPLFSWVSELPLFKLVVFWKYSEPIIGFSMAVLAAVGFDLLATGRVRRNGFLIGSAIALAVLLTFGLFDKQFLWGEHSVHQLFNNVLTLAVAMILTATLIATLAIAKPNSRLKSCRFLLLMLLADLSFSFLLPTFYWFHQLASNQNDPYKGAPYVQFLQSQLTDNDRVLGFDGILFPNWSSAYEIRDLRNLDAMYPARYLAFIRNFLAVEDPKELADFNLTTRFHGQEKLADPLFAATSREMLTRLWYLSSVRYLLGSRDHFIGEPTALTREILHAIPPTEQNYVHLDAFTIDAVTKHVLFQHPHDAADSNEIKYTCTISKQQPFLDFSIALDPQVYGIAYGDGMTFTIEVDDTHTQTKVFSKYIDPKTSQSDRHWFSESVDLSKYEGERVALLFKVDGGPANNTMADWGGWADMQFSQTGLTTSKDTLSSGSRQNQPKPQLVYDKEIKIYRTREALPRAAVFYNYKLANTDEESLRLLKSTKFDVSSTIVLDGSGVNSAILPLPLSQPEPCQPQKVLSHSPLTVKVAVTAKHEGMLMLNDQHYPGWNAYVDGVHTELIRADHVFRAVPVKEGSHEVLFKYEPLSFYAGACTCAFTLFALSAYAFFINRRKPEQDL